MTTHSIRLWALALWGIVAVSCGYSAPYHNSGPSIAKEGVQLSVTGQQCYVNRTSDPFRTSVGDDRLNVELLVGVANQTKGTAILDPQRMLVVEGVDGKGVDLLATDRTVVTLGPGESKTVPLRFERVGDLDCHHALVLDAGNAVSLDGHRVVMQPIAFSTVHSLD